MSTDPNILEPRPEPCSKSADVVFAVDTSAYLDVVKLRSYVVAVIRDIVENLRVDEELTRVAVVSYSTQAQVDSITSLGQE